MPSKRKPLIEPGSLLPPAETMIERIVARDRINTGRQTPPAPEIDATESIPVEKDNITSNMRSNITTHITAQPDSKKVARAGKQQAALINEQPATQQSAQVNAPAAAQQLAQELAATPLIPITLRLPDGLNDWLDDYAHAHRKEGIKKQDLVTRAVQLLIMELYEG